MPSSLPTKLKISSGSVTYRSDVTGIRIVVIGVGGDDRRWQLPKGLVDAGESPEQAAIRETREEGGIDAELIAPLEKIEYWYVGSEDGARVRYHKFVYFFLLRYLSGDVRNHDREIDEARWFLIDHAIDMLTFASEQKIARVARDLLIGRDRSSG